MTVVPLTLTISLCLVFTFVVFFLREHSRRRFGSAESEALLPLADEARSIGGRPAGKCDENLLGR
jgi:cbb3-type cytochrome oxidase subunit 3